MSKKILEKFVLLVGLIALGIGAVYLKRQIRGDDLMVYSNYSGVTVIDRPMPVTPLVLQSSKGAFGRQDLLNKWSFVFFGYTHCPDVCPSTMTLLQQVDKALNNKDDRVQTVFITLDPQRDRVEHMRDYVGYFNKRFIGLSGEHQSIATLARNMGVLYEKNALVKDGYSINHSASIFLVNPQGEAQARFSAQYADVATIVAETRRLMRAN